MKNQRKIHLSLICRLICGLICGLVSGSSSAYIDEPTMEREKIPIIGKCEPMEVQNVNLLGDTIKSRTESVCHDEANKVFVSKSCKKSCRLMDSAKSQKSPLAVKNVGSPGAVLCEAVGGSFQKVFFLLKGEKTLGTICVLGADFASVEYLHYVFRKAHKH